MPVVEPPGQFADLLGRHRGPLLLGDAAGPPWHEAARALPEQGRLVIAVGPEGGFTPAEAAQAAAAGVQAVTLGPRILRAETAALAVLAVVQYAKGDLGSAAAAR